LRVIRSLYQDSVLVLEQNEDRLSELSNRSKLDSLSDRNEELKRLIRKLNEDTELLRAEKNLLIE
jgi:cell division protein FtsB